MKPFSKCTGMALAILLVGCSLSRPIHREASAIGALPPESRIVVYPDSGRLYEMRFEEIRNDTLFGYMPDGNVRQPRARIDSLFLVRNDPVCSVLFVLTALLVADAARRVMPNSGRR